jgi:hypothetical protein
MILKLQSILFPYARHREPRKKIILTKSDRIAADRLIMGLLLIAVIIAAVIFS